MGKLDYEAPQIEVMEMEMEDTILATSGTTSISDAKDGGAAF